MRIGREDRIKIPRDHTNIPVGRKPQHTLSISIIKHYIVIVKDLDIIISLIYYYWGKGASSSFEVLFGMTTQDITQTLKKLSKDLTEISISELLKSVRRLISSKKFSGDLRRKLYMLSSNPEVIRLIKDGKLEKAKVRIERLQISSKDLEIIANIITDIISKNKEALTEKTPEIKNPYFLYSLHSGRILSPEEYKAVLEFSGLYKDREVIEEIVSLYEKLVKSLEVNDTETAIKIIDSLPKLKVSELTYNPITLFLLILSGYPKILYELCTYQSLESTSEIADSLYKMLYELCMRPSTGGIMDEIVLKIKRSLAFHYFLTRDYEKVLTILKELEYIEGSGRGTPDSRAVIYNLYLHVYSEMGNKKKLVEYINRLKDIVNLIASPYIRVAMFNSLGNYLQALGEIQKALEAYNKGYEIAKRYNITYYADVIPHNIAVIKYSQGYYEEAEKIFQEVLASRRKTSTEYAIAYILMNMASLYIESKKCKKALEAMSEIERIIRKIADVGLQIESLLNCAYYYMRCESSPEKSLEILRELSKNEKIIKNIKGSLKLSIAMAFAETYYRLGNLEQALNYASLAHSYLRPYGDAWMMFNVSTLLALIYLEKAKLGSPIYEDAAQSLIKNEIEPLRKKLGIVRNPLYDELKEKLKKR